MADNAQNIDTIGVGLTLDTSGFDQGLTKARTALTSFERSRATTLRAPQTMAIAPVFKVTQAQVRGLRVDINQHMSSLAARNEAVAVPVKLGQSDWAGMRQQITQKIGVVPVQVKVAGGGVGGLSVGGRAAVAGRADPVQVLAAWIAQTQGLSLPNAQTQLVRAARSKGISGRAAGGPVVQDRPYLVGENGPEVVRFNQGGTVYPRHRGGYAGGGFVEETPFQRRVREMRENASRPPAPLPPPQPSVEPEWMRRAREQRLAPKIFRAGGGYVKPISYGPGFAHRQGGGDVEGIARAELERLLARYNTPADRLHRPWQPGDTSLDPHVFPELRITDDAWLPSGKYERGMSLKGEPTRRATFKINRHSLGRRQPWREVAPPGVRGPAAAYAATHEFGHYFDDTVAGTGFMGDGRTYAASPLDAAFHHAMMELDMGFSPEESWLRRRQWSSPDDLTKHLSPFPQDRLDKLPSYYARNRPGEASAEYFTAVERQPSRLWTPGTRHMAGVLEGYRRRQGGGFVEDPDFFNEFGQSGRLIETLHHANRVIRLAPKVFGPVGIGIEALPDSMNRNGAAAHFNEYQNRINFDPDYLGRATEGSLRETIHHEYGHALQSYLRNGTYPGTAMERNFNLLSMKGPFISQYPDQRFEDVYAGLQPRGHTPISAARLALGSALNENFAETFSSMGEPLRRTSLASRWGQSEMGGSSIPRGIGMGHPSDEVSMDEWKQILMDRFGVYKYTQPGYEDRFQAPLGVWNRMMPGQNHSLDLRRAMAGILRHVGRLQRGGRINRPGRGGKYGAARGEGGGGAERPGEHWFPGSVWPNEFTDETGYLYHGTLDMAAIRGMERDRSVGGSGVQPTSENRHLANTSTMGATSYWALSAQDTGDYGNSVLRTRKTKDFEGPYSYDLDEPGVIATKPYSGELGTGEMYEIVAGERTIPRKDLQYYGADDAWHKFRRGRRRNGGGPVNPFARSGIQAELDFEFSPGNPAMRRPAFQIGPFEGDLLRRMRDQDIEYGVGLDPQKGAGKFSDIRRMIGFAKGEEGEVDWSARARQPMWHPKPIESRYAKPDRMGNREFINAAGLISMHNHPIGGVTQGVEGWRPSTADIASFMADKFRESWVATPSFTSIMRRRMDTPTRPLGDQAVKHLMLKHMLPHYSMEQLMQHDFINGPEVSGNYTMWKELQSELAAFGHYDLELWKHPKPSADQLGMGFGRGGYMAAQKGLKAKGTGMTVAARQAMDAETHRRTYDTFSTMLGHYQQTNPERFGSSLTWYQRNQRTLNRIADAVGIPRDAAASIVAEISSNNPWPNNALDLFRLFPDSWRRDPSKKLSNPMATGRNKESIWEILKGRGAVGIKKNAFMGALQGDPMGKPADVWMARLSRIALPSDRPEGFDIGMGFDQALTALHHVGSEGRKGGPGWTQGIQTGEIRAIHAAIDQIASETGFEPRGIQAALWDVIRDRSIALGITPPKKHRRQKGGEVGGPGEGILRPWNRQELVQHHFQVEEDEARAYSLRRGPQYKADRMRLWQGTGATDIPESLDVAGRLARRKSSERHEIRGLTGILGSYGAEDNILKDIDAALARLPEAISEPGMSRLYQLRHIKEWTAPLINRFQEFFPKDVVREGPAKPWDRKLGHLNYEPDNLMKEPHARWLPGDSMFDDRRNAQGGHERGAQTYLVGELNPELFIPDRLRYIIPPDVMDALPKRSGGGETRRMGSGVIEVGTKGPHLFTPPEDGWIIPHTLTGRVNPLIPRAARGRRPRGMSATDAELLGLDKERFTEAADDLSDYGQNIIELMQQDIAGAAQAISGRNFSSATVAQFTAGGRQGQFRRGLIARQAIGRAQRAYREGAPVVTAGEQAAERIPQVQDLRTRIEAERTAARGARAGGVYDEARARLAALGEPTPGQRRIVAFARAETGPGADKKWAREILANEAKIRDLTSGIGAANRAIAGYTDMVTEGEKAQASINATTAEAVKAGKKAQPSAFAKLANLGQVMGAQFIAAQVVMGGISKLVAGAEPGITRWIDSLTGFAETNAQVTASLGASSRQRGGRIGETVAAAGLPAGLSAEAVGLLASRLGPGITGKAGAQAEGEVSQLFRAAQGNAAPTGLYGGFGGIFGSALLAEGLGGSRGFTETIRADTQEIAGRPGGVIQPLTNADFPNVSPENYAKAMGLKTDITAEFFTDERVRKRTQEARQQQFDLLFPDRAGQEQWDPSKIPGQVADIPGGIGDWLATTPFGPALQAVGAPVGAAAGPRLSSEDKRTAELYGPSAPATLNGLSPQAMEMTKARLADLSQSAERGAKAMGAHEKVTWELVDATSAEAKAASEAAYAASDMPSYLNALDGIIIKVNGDVAKTADEHRRAVELTARGRSVPDLKVWAQTVSQGLRAGRETNAVQLANELTTQIPAMLDQTLAANPLQTRAQIAAEVGPLAGVPRGRRQAIQRSITAASESNRAVEAQAAEGRTAAMTFITENLSASDAQAYSGYLDQAAGYGREILALQTRIAKINMGQQAKEFAANMILAKRALADALGLAGRGGSRFGQLQRQDYFLGRESQSLSMGLQQRQINFSIATAGFTAGGVTGEEVAAKQTEAKIEASYAQQQLDIERERFGIALQMFNISNERAVADARRSRDLLAASYENTKLMSALVKDIKAKELAQGEAMQKAQAIFQAANRNYGNILSEATGYVAQFGGTIRAATEALQTVLGIKPSERQGGKADGFLGTVTGATTMLMGEAGTETVAILRNPRTAAIPQGGGGNGGGGGTITVNIMGAVVREEGDIQKIAAAIEERLNRRVGLLGLRTPGG